MSTFPFGPPDKTWTLFLDRDGVINERLPGDYIKSVGEFRFLPGVINAVSRLSAIFGRIIIVTNQQGIGKGLMTENDLELIHRMMVEQIAAAGGLVDAVFHCPHKAEDACSCRKPATGMFDQARQLFPDIDPSRSVMVGDTRSDLRFARNCGMYAVQVGEEVLAGEPADAYASSLSSFALSFFILNKLKP